MLLLQLSSIILAATSVYTENLISDGSWQIRLPASCLHPQLNRSSLLDFTECCYSMLHSLW